MAFFRMRALSPVERFESALREKQAARESLAERLKAAEAALGERRDAAERLAIASAADAELDRAEKNMRAADDRAKTLKAATTQLDEQIVTIERELADAAGAVRECEGILEGPGVPRRNRTVSGNRGIVTDEPRGQDLARRRVRDRLRSVHGAAEQLASVFAERLWGGYEWRRDRLLCLHRIRCRVDYGRRSKKSAAGHADWNHC